MISIQAFAIIHELYVYIFILFVLLLLVPAWRNILSKIKMQKIKSGIVATLLLISCIKCFKIKICLFMHCKAFMELLKSERGAIHFEYLDRFLFLLTLEYQIELNTLL